jgi:HEAT repeat protein
MPLLKECLGSEDKALFRVALRMAHEIGGPEVAKTLMQALELPDASEAAEKELVIKKAEYGAGDKQLDVTEQVIAAVASGSPITASNSLAGDPANGQVKQMRVVFIKDGQEQTVEVPENEQFSIEGSVAQHPRQVLLISALGDLGQKDALPIVLEAAQSGAWDIRRAAIRVLGGLGDASAVPVLLSTAVEGGGLSQAAFESLTELEGQEVDGAVAKALDGAKGDKRVILIKLAGERGVASAIPALKQAADDKDQEVATAALHALATTVGPDQLSLLTDRLVKPRSPEEAATAKDALRKAVLRMPDRDACAVALLASMSAASATAKSDLLDLVGVVGGDKALGGVAEAAKGGSDEIQDAATRVLGGWMSPDAAPVLLDLAKTGNDKFKIRCLRGYIRIVRQFGLPDDQRLAMCRQAMDVATRDDEKRLVLDALTRVLSPAAMNMIVPHLDDPGLKEAASTAAVAIAEKIVNDHPAAVAEAMEKASGATNNDELAKRAKSLMNRAKRKLRQR